MQFSVAVSNGRLDSIETTIGASPILRIRTGAAPANNAAADTGTVLSTINLPADWMAAAANRTKNLNGTWADDAADAAGTAGHYRVYAADGTTCHIQGPVGATGSGLEMILDNLVFAAGQAFSIISFTINDPNG